MNRKMQKKEVTRKGKSKIGERVFLFLLSNTNAFKSTAICKFMRSTK